VAPGVIFAHDYHGTCISGTKTIRAPTARCCERTFGPSCLVQYYPRHCGGWSPVTMVQLYGLQRARLGLLASYERIAVASRHMAEEYARHGFASKVRVVGLPIESPVAPAARDDGDGAWRLLYLGRLEFAKGADLALESAARTAALMMRPVHLQISGAGSLDATIACQRRSDARSIAAIWSPAVSCRRLISASNARLSRTSPQPSAPRAMTARTATSITRTSSLACADRRVRR